MSRKLQVVGYSTSNDKLSFGRLPFIRAEVCGLNISDSLAVFLDVPDKFCVGFVKSE